MFASFYHLFQPLVFSDLIEEISRGKKWSSSANGSWVPSTGGTKSVDRISVIFHVLLIEQLFIKCPPDPHAKYSLFAIRQSCLSVLASDSTHISSAEGGVRVIAWLAGHSGACLSLHLPLTERVSSLTFSIFYPASSSLVHVLPLKRW